jgi:hypothetical protein
LKGDFEMDATRIEELRAEADRIEAELKAVEEAKAEAAHRLERAKGKAVYHAQDFKVQLSRLEHFKAIVTEFQKLGWDQAQCGLVKGKAKIAPLGDLNAYHYTPIEFDYNYAGGGMWGSRKKTEVIVVGSYGNSVRYPKRKDGKFSYNKIAEKWIGKYKARLIQQRREREARETRENSQYIKELLSAQFGLSKWNSVISSSKFHGDKVKISVEVTEEQAREILSIVYPDEN